VVLFGVSTLIHLVHALISRHWFILPTAVLAGCGEILGWSARLWSNQNILASDPFTIQIACLIISPTPLLGSHFIIFGRLVQLLGPQFSRFRPRLYSRIFLTCDVVSLVIQAIGGGIASSATTDSATNLGTHVMLAGIITQLVILIVFSIIALEFMYCFNIDKPFRQEAGDKTGAMDKRRRIGLYAVCLSTTCLFIRAIFRVVELSGGWNGTVIHTQWAFDLFDATMVTIAMFTWNFVPSSWILAEYNTHHGQEIGMQYNTKQNPSYNSSL